MFERFRHRFLPDASSETSAVEKTPVHEGGRLLDKIRLEFNGQSFNGGLYRVMTSDRVLLADAFVARAFPAFAGKISSFSYDWLGRIFALDHTKCVDASPVVIMFEPGTGKALKIPCNLQTFHENELVDHGEAALATNFLKQWLASGGAAPRTDQCVGYKLPLYLGGNDGIENLELSDLDVYWTLSGELIQKTRGLPPGTRVSKVRWGG